MPNIIFRLAPLQLAILMAGSLAISGCSSKTGSSTAPDPEQPEVRNETPEAPQYSAGEYPPMREFANRCAAPRTGLDANDEPWPDMPGTAMDEKMWLRSMTQELYLWNDLLPDLDPADYSVEEYFHELTIDQDRFAQSMRTAVFEASTEQGVELSYGVIWDIQADNTGTITARIAFVEPNSSAADSLERGDYIVTVDGIDVASAQQDQAVSEVLGDYFYPESSGQSHLFGVRDGDSGDLKEVTLTANYLPQDPVPISRVLETEQGPLGYLLFNDHNDKAETRLINVVETFRDAAVNDVVVDLRFNQGGYVEIAAQLAYMIAGPDHTQGLAFEMPEFNSLHPQFNPVNMEPLAPIPFYQETLGFDDSNAGAALPYLGLDRVYVLTSEATCSASESFINSLNGVDVEVIQVGDATCGKPYGYLPVHNCGTTYLTVMFTGENAKGFSGFGEGGFMPSNSSTSSAPDQNPGCVLQNPSVDRPLGDVDEELLSTALHFRAESSCPATDNGSNASRVESFQQFIPGAKLRWTR